MKWILRNWFTKMGFFPLGMWVILTTLFAAGSIKCLGYVRAGYLMDFVALAVFGSLTIVLVLAQGYVSPMRHKDVCGSDPASNETQTTPQEREKRE